MSNFDRYELISLFKSEPAFYDKNDINFKNTKYKVNKLKEFADSLDVPGDVIKHRWKTLRDQFIRELKNPKKTEHIIRRWKYYDALSFLHNHMELSPRGRVRKTNLRGDIKREAENTFNNYDEQSLNNEHEDYFTTPTPTVIRMCATTTIPNKKLAIKPQTQESIQNSENGQVLEYSEDGEDQNEQSPTQFLNVECYAPISCDDDTTDYICEKNNMETTMTVSSTTALDDFFKAMAKKVKTANLSDTLQMRLEEEVLLCVNNIIRANMTN